MDLQKCQEKMTYFSSIRVVNQDTRCYSFLNGFVKCYKICPQKNHEKLLESYPGFYFCTKLVCLLIFLVYFCTIQRFSCLVLQFFKIIPYVIFDLVLS